VVGHTVGVTPAIGSSIFSSSTTNPGRRAHSPGGRQGNSQHRHRGRLTSVSQGWAPPSQQAQFDSGAHRCFVVRLRINGSRRRCRQDVSRQECDLAAPNFGGSELSSPCHTPRLWQLLSGVHDESYCRRKNPPYPRAKTVTSNSAGLSTAHANTARKYRPSKLNASTREAGVRLFLRRAPLS